MRKTLSLFAVMLIFSVARLSYADMYYGGAIGNGDVDVTGYDDAVVFRMQMGQRNYNVGYEFGLSFGSYDVSGSGGAASTDVSEFDFNLMGYLPITPTVSAFGRIGAMYWNADAVVYTNLIVGSDDGVGLIYGAGFDLSLSPRWDMRIEMQALPDISDADINHILLGFNYRI